MKRLAVAVLCLAAVSACKKEEAKTAPPPKEAEAPEAAVAPEAAEEEAAAAEPAEEKLVVTDELMVRFLSYWEKTIVMSQARMKELDDVTKKADEKGGAMGAAHALQGANSISERAEAQHDALLREHKLTEDQVRELQELVTGIGGTLFMHKSANPEKLIADMRKGLEDAKKNATPEQFAEAKKQVDEMEAGLKEQARFQTQRDEFGDAAVDVAVKHKDKILELQERAFGVLK